MREIKFRGRCSQDSKYAGEWVKGGCVQPYTGDVYLIIKAHADNCTSTYHVDQDTIGQYTGLKDKHGKEIYEGDIVKSQFSDTPFGIVKWHGNGYFFIDSSFGEWENFGNGFLPIGELMERQIDGQVVQIEVIGDVHNNPELLKTKDE